jgi:hypothetical protein
MKKLISVIIALILLTGGAMFYFSEDPDTFNVIAYSNTIIEKDGIKSPVVGTYTVLTTIKLMENVLDKKGGYISNDYLPPFLFLDNIPNWEFGVLEVVRATAVSFRSDLSRSQSQSVENKSLALASPKFNIDSKAWILPAAENEYRDGLVELRNYYKGINDTSDSEYQFYARADNLEKLLSVFSDKLGSLSQRLSASVATERVNTDLANDASAEQSTHTSNSVHVETSFFEIDDVFYQSRGQAYAILHLLKATRYDFIKVLEKKNALASYDQIIKDLESTQQQVWSLMILNGSGFGTITNHSLVISNYISRSNAAMIDLIELLKKG